MFSEEDASRLQELVSRGKLTPQEHLEACKLLQEKILDRRGGELMPSSVDVIRSMRDDDPDGFYYTGD